MCLNINQYSEILVKMMKRDNNRIYIIRILQNIMIYLICILNKDNWHICEYCSTFKWYFNKNEINYLFWKTQNCSFYSNIQLIILENRNHFFQSTLMTKIYVGLKDNINLSDCLQCQTSKQFFNVVSSICIPYKYVW